MPELTGLEILIAFGLLVWIAGQIWLLVEAYHVSKLWFVACFFIPFAAAGFLVAHRNRAAKPFALILLGLAIVLYAAFNQPRTR